MARFNKLMDEIAADLESGVVTTPQIRKAEEIDDIEDIPSIETYAKEFKKESEAIKRREKHVSDKLRNVLNSIVEAATPQQKSVKQTIDNLQKLQINVQKELDDIQKKIDLYQERIESSPEKFKVKFKTLYDKCVQIKSELELQQNNIKTELSKYDTITVEQAEQQKSENQQEFDREEINKQLVSHDIVKQSEIEKIDSVELVDTIVEATEAIPDDVDFDDIQVKISAKSKSKAGYYKTKVSIKVNNIPEIVNNIASYIKQHSKGLISPRVCDLRVIGNTNKTQLRNASLKLTSRTIVFKPDHTRLRVNKGTRFMISIPENYSESNPTLIVYLQESRSKTIMEVSSNDFDSKLVFIEWVGDMIANYYTYGFEMTVKKLQLRQTSNPYVQLVTSVLRQSNQYRCKLNDDGISFKTTVGENQWLLLTLQESQTPGLYELIGSSNMYPDITYSNLIGKLQPLNYFEKNMLTILDKIYSKDWSKELKATLGDEDFELNKAFTKNYAKLTHSKLKSAYIRMHNIMLGDDEIPNDSDLQIIRTLSKSEFSNAIKLDDSYDAEAIMGQTDQIQFVLVYLAKQLVGGDSRHGSTYITTDSYYQKYDVKTRQDYDVRKKVDSDRHYNARKYMFQLKYKFIDTGREYEVFAKTFDEILELTDFLTSTPQKV